MSRALVHLSSSQGDRMSQLALALERISYGNELVATSNVFEAAGDGVHTDSVPLLCCGAVIETDMSAPQLLRFLMETETQLGRDRKPAGQGFRPVPIDLDLVLFDDSVLRTPLLTLPHPRAHERAWVMVPAAEVAPDWEHPVLHRSLSDLAREREAANGGWGAFHASAEKLLRGR